MKYKTYKPDGETVFTFDTSQSTSSTMDYFYNPLQEKNYYTKDIYQTEIKYKKETYEQLDKYTFTKDDLNLNLDGVKEFYSEYLERFLKNEQRLNARAILKGTVFDSCKEIEKEDEEPHLKQEKEQDFEFDPEALDL